MTSVPVPGYGAGPLGQGRQSRRITFTRAAGRPTLWSEIERRGKPRRSLFPLPRHQRTRAPFHRILAREMAAISLNRRGDGESFWVSIAGAGNSGSRAPGLPSIPIFPINKQFVDRTFVLFPGRASRCCCLRWLLIWVVDFRCLEEWAAPFFSLVFRMTRSCLQRLRRNRPSETTRSRLLNSPASWRPPGKPCSAGSTNNFFHPLCEPNNASVRASPCFLSY